MNQQQHHHHQQQEQHHHHQSSPLKRTRTGSLMTSPTLPTTTIPSTTSVQQSSHYMTPSNNHQQPPYSYYTHHHHTHQYDVPTYPYEIQPPSYDTHHHHHHHQYYQHYGPPPPSNPYYPPSQPPAYSTSMYSFPHYVSSSSSYPPHSSYYHSYVIPDISALKQLSGNLPVNNTTNTSTSASQRRSPQTSHRQSLQQSQPLFSQTTANMPYHSDSNNRNYAYNNNFQLRPNTSSGDDKQNSDDSLLTAVKSNRAVHDMLDPIFETLDYLDVKHFRSGDIKTRNASGVIAISTFYISDRIFRLVSSNETYYVSFDLFTHDLSHALNWKNFDLLSLQINNRECFNLLPKMNVRLEKKAKRFSKKTVASSPMTLGREILNQGGNHIVMSTKTQLNAILIIRLVKRRTIGELIEIVRARPTLSTNKIKAEQCDPYDEDVIEQAGEAIPLLDPLTLCRMQIPSRGIKCDHQSCFDLTSFLEYAHTSKSWLCPCCQTYLPFNELMVDELMTKALADPKSLKFKKVIVRPGTQLEFVQPVEDDSDEESDRDHSDIDLNAPHGIKKRKIDQDASIVVIDLDQD